MKNPRKKDRKRKKEEEISVFNKNSTIKKNLYSQRERKREREKERTGQLLLQCAAHIFPNYHYGKEKENINRLQYLKINQKINGRSYFGLFSSHSPVHLDPSPKTFVSTKLKEQYLKCAVPSYQRWSSFPKKKEGN